MQQEKIRQEQRFGIIHKISQMTPEEISKSDFNLSYISYKEAVIKNLSIGAIHALTPKTVLTISQSNLELLGFDTVQYLYKKFYNYKEKKVLNKKGKSVEIDYYPLREHIGRLVAKLINDTLNKGLETDDFNFKIGLISEKKLMETLSITSNKTMMKLRSEGMLELDNPISLYSKKHMYKLESLINLYRKTYIRNFGDRMFKQNEILRLVNKSIIMNEFGMNRTIFSIKEKHETTNYFRLTNKIYRYLIDDFKEIGKNATEA